MNKKKLTAIILSGVILFCFISCGFIFLLAKEIQAGNFLTFANNESEAFRERLHYSETLESAKSNFAFRYYTPNYPAVIALVDKDGNVVCKNSTGIHLIYKDKEKDIEKVYYIDVEKYLTDEIISKLSEFCGKYRGGMLAVKSLSFCFDGDGNPIPVEGVLYNNPEKKESLTIKFTDKTPEYTASDEGGSSIALYGFRRNDNKVYSKYVEATEADFRKYLREFKPVHSDVSYGGGGTSAGGLYQFEESFEIEGEPYFFYYNSRYDMNYDALTSDVFKTYVIETGIVYFFITVLLIIVALKLFDKNERLKKSREAFISAAAHELKTPLAVIANKSECILEDVSPEINMEYVNSIYDESKRMSRMVKTMLQYNRLTSNTKTEKQRENLSDMVSSEAKKYKPLFEDKNISYTQDIDPKLYLNCNRELICLALDNLLSNAVKFTKPDGNIHISAMKGDKTKVEVFNSGSSISGEDAPHIWDELYVGDKSRTREDNSSGMGLAIAGRIFKLHGYSYGFENLKDGVIFRFSEK